MPPELMYACGGDRKFFRLNHIDPAEFLRETWQANGDRDRLISWVKKTAENSRRLVLSCKISPNIYTFRISDCFTARSSVVCAGNESFSGRNISWLVAISPGSACFLPTKPFYIGNPSGAYEDDSQWSNGHPTTGKVGIVLTGATFGSDTTSDVFSQSATTTYTITLTSPQQYAQALEFSRAGISTHKSGRRRGRWHS